VIMIIGCLITALSLNVTLRSGYVWGLVLMPIGLIVIHSDSMVWHCYAYN